MASEKKIKVRLATPRDVVRIGKLLEDHDPRLTIGYAPVNDVRLYQWILEIIQTGVCAVADLSGRIVGLMGATPFQPPWSLNWAYDVDFYYILENFRGEGLERALLKAVEGWVDNRSKRLGYRMPLTLSINTGDRAEAKTRMVSMNTDYTFTGGNFVRMSEATDGQQEVTEHEHGTT